MNRPAGFLVLMTAALSVSCSNPSGPESDRNTLVFTRADQSTISFSSAALVYVWCGPWEDGVADTPSLQVLIRGPGAEDPGWHLRAVTADVTIGEPLVFPNSFVFDQPKDVDLFVLDPPNELSTQDGRSSGSITFQRLPCETGDMVEFSIDAVVGSEFGAGPSVQVAGTFRAPIRRPPSGSGGLLALHGR